VKIADFGLSALVRIGEDGYDVEESSKRKKYRGLTEMWGTKEYFAPELIDQAYGPQADLWALGCILFEMLCGHQGEDWEREGGREGMGERERERLGGGREGEGGI
jgi:serine/threonine protein kinase